MAKTVLDVLIERLDSDIERASEFLTSGRAEDHSSYRELCGLIRGLETAKDYIKAHVQQLENEDDF